MKDITKEIRDWALNTACISNGAKFEFDRIVDGIDSYFWDAMQDKQNEIYKVNFDNSNMQDKLVVSMPLLVDADGVRCKLGDKMYCGAFVFAIAGVGRVDDSDVIFYKDSNGVWEWVSAKLCHHESIDSQVKIDIDSRKTMVEYWDCENGYCTECPVKIDGERPLERYNTRDCDAARCVELISRQRRLDSES